MSSFHSTPLQLVRFPTPFRKDMKALKAKRKKGKYKPEATPSTTIFRKGSASSRDDLNALAGNSTEAATPQEDGPAPIKDAPASIKKSQDSLGDFKDVSVWVGVWLSGWGRG